VNIFNCVKQTTRFQYEIYDNIQDISFFWDNFLPDNHTLESQNLLILERSRLEDINFRYLVIREDEKLVGLVCLQEIRFSAKHYDNAAFSENALLQFISPCILSQTADLLVCGNFFRMNFPCFYFAEHLAPETIGQILTDYIEIRKPEKKFAGVFLKDMGNLNLKEIQGLSFKTLPDDLTMEMEIPDSWQNIENYAQNLSKKYRQRFKKIQTSAQNIDRKELNLEEIESNAQQIFKLYEQVVEQQSIRIGIVSPEYFVEMKRSMGDNFKIIAYLKEEKLVAFASYIFYENQTFEIHYIGFDYKENEAHQIYLNILFDGLVIGINTKQKSVELGRTARLAKASLGAKPVYLHSYYAMRLGLPAIVFGVLSYFFGNKMGEDWKNRNPMK
jgi:DNA-binding ferritin-like protein (Dps family)